MPVFGWQLSFFTRLTGVCTPACLLAASISVEAVTPPLVGWPNLKSYFQSRGRPSGSQSFVSVVRLCAYALDANRSQRSSKMYDRRIESELSADDWFSHSLDLLPVSTYPTRSPTVRMGWSGYPKKAPSWKRALEFKANRKAPSQSFRTTSRWMTEPPRQRSPLFRTNAMMSCFSPRAKSLSVFRALSQNSARRPGRAQPSCAPTNSWMSNHRSTAKTLGHLRGALKDIFTELEGGEVYLHADRDAFRSD